MSIPGLTFHLQNHMRLVHARRGAHMTPVPAPVLRAAPPDDQRGVAPGDQIREEAGVVVMVMSMPVLVARLLLAVLVTPIVTVVLLPLPLLHAVRRLEALHQHILPEPADDLVAGGLEGAR